MITYLAGPMTGHAEWNFPAFDAAKRTLESRGWVVISPADLDRADGFSEAGATGREDLGREMRQRFARNDLNALLRSDAVHVLPGWEKSTGARNEVMVAGWLGLPVYDLTGERIDAPHEFAGKATPTVNARAECLRTAEALVNGDRNAQYGDPRQDFERTATMWGAYLGCEVQAHDVAALMALLKVSRIRWSPGKQDSWVDLAGYAACGWDCASAI